MRRISLFPLIFLLVWAELAQAEPVVLKKIKIEEQKNQIWGSGLSFYQGLFYSVIDAGSGTESSVVVFRIQNETVDILNHLPITPRVPDLDLEGISVTKKGSAWVCDESGPLLIKLSLKTGQRIKLFSPEKGLPGRLKNIQLNRGCEGLTNAGKYIYMIIQSPLETEGDKNRVYLIRFNKKSEQTKRLRVKIDKDFFSNPNEVKFGGLATVSEDQLLAIQSGTDKSGKMQYRIVKLELKKKKKKIKPKLLLDLGELGWKHTKPEGIAWLPDSGTLVLTNDIDQVDPQSFRELWFIKP